MAADHRGGLGGSGGGLAAEVVRPAEGVAARERCRPAEAGHPVGGADGGGEEKAAACDVELG